MAGTPQRASDDALTIGAVENTVKILEAVKELDGARNVDIADYTGLSKASVHKHLNTHERAGFITANDGVYQLGFRFLDIGEWVRERIQGKEYIQNALDKLVEETNEISSFILEENGQAVIVYRRQGREGVNTQSRSGKRRPMNQNAAGKAILAHRSDEFVEEVIQRHGLPRYTEFTITDRERFYDELETVRERGFAFNEEESSLGIHAVSVPVITDGEVRGACSVLGPKRRLSGEYFREDIPDLLLTISNELALNLKNA